MIADPAAFAARFTAMTLAKEEWTHAAHLTVGTWHVDRHGAAEALPLLRAICFWRFIRASD